jgi:inhibitor of KinA sporulation pathway (predicted exonuclease)
MKPILNGIGKRKKTNKMKYDKIIVIDIESTCWKENVSKNINEIIEIGICPIDTKSKKVLEPNSIMVKPTHSTVSEFCTSLTTLTQEDVDKGVSFNDACSILINEYDTNKYVWASYGFYDRNQFEDQCERENVEYPFSNSHINVKILFALVNSLRRQVGMTDALKILNIPLKGTHHRGVDDAQNIAKILSRILFKGN